jgi:hypothetical protein
MYRGKCRHQKEAMGLLCGWDEARFSIKQTPEQARDMTCPVCGRSTTWQMDAI